MTEPLLRIAADRVRARAANDPMAGLCVLATVDAEGQPQVRTLVLREIGEKLALFMNQTSPKFTQLDSGRASICIYLPSIQVQYRARIELTPVPREIIRDSWQLRPNMPKVLDWYYTAVQPQSTTVESHVALRAALGSLPLDTPLEAPHTACGYYLEPLHVERLDLAQPDGLHERLSWRREGAGWIMETWVP